MPKVRQVEKVVGLVQDNLKVVELPGPEKIVTQVIETVKTLIE